MALRPGKKVKVKIAGQTYKGVVTQGPVTKDKRTTLYRVEYKRGAGKVENLFPVDSIEEDE